MAYPLVEQAAPWAFVAVTIGPGSRWRLIVVLYGGQDGSVGSEFWPVEMDATGPGVVKHGT